LQIGVAQASSTQGSPTQIRLLQHHAVQIKSTQVGMRELDSRKVRRGLSGVFLAGAIPGFFALQQNLSVFGRAFRYWADQRR
jgi:hypothetical protein